MKNERIIVTVPMNGYQEKWDVTPLTELFSTIGADELIEILRSIHNDCADLYVRSLEMKIDYPDDGEQIETKPSLMGKLSILNELIDQIGGCHPAEKEVAA